jgi:hypothetical protein
LLLSVCKRRVQASSSAGGEGGPSILCAVCRMVHPCSLKPAAPVHVPNLTARPCLLLHQSCCRCQQWVLLTQARFLSQLLSVRRYAGY